METAINVGGKVEKETAELMTKAVVEIFKAGHEYHMDQETVRTALCQFSECVSIEGLTIEGATIIGDRTVNMDSKEKL